MFRAENDEILESEDGPLPERMSSKCEKEFRAYEESVRKMPASAPMIYMNGISFNPETLNKMDDSAHFMNECYPKLMTTYQEMVKATVKYEAERFFKELFDNMAANSHDWDCFYSIENGQYVWAERSCGMLGNLATIYRQRGWLKESIAVMKFYKKRIAEYNGHIIHRKIQGLADVDEMVCCKQLTYKYHRVAINLAMDADVWAVPYDTSDVHKSYRHLIRYEIEKGLVDNEEQNEFAWLLESLLKRPMTIDGLNRTTNEELTKVHSTLVLLNRKENKENGRTGPGQRKQSQEDYVKQFGHMTAAPWGGSVDLHPCEHCRKPEPYIAAYKKCSKCHTTRYCSRECQKANFSQHKRECKTLAAAAQEAAAAVEAKKARASSGHL